MSALVGGTAFVPLHDLYLPQYHGSRRTMGKEYKCRQIYLSPLRLELTWQRYVGSFLTNLAVKLSGFGVFING